MTQEQPLQYSRRLDWIDQLKGLAILCIVIFHFYQRYPKEFELIALLDREGARVALAAVDLFFVVAGFTTSYVMILKLKKHNLSLASINFKSWLVSRLIRIYPAYFLAVVCSLLLYYFFKTLPRFNINLLLSMIGLADYSAQSINPGFWFFRVLLQAYLIMPLILPLAIKNPVMILWLGIIGGVVVKIIGLSLPHTSWLYPYFLQNNSIGSYWLQLCLGLYWGVIFYHKNEFRKIDYAVSIGCFVIGCVLFFVLPSLGIDMIYKLGTDLFMTPILFLLNYFIFSRLNQQIHSFKPIKFSLDKLSILGNNSYQIYLIHQPLYFVVIFQLTKRIVLNPYLKSLVILGVAILLLIPYVIIFTRIENWLKKRIGSWVPN